MASRTRVGIRPPASRGLTSITTGPRLPRRISVWAGPKPRPRALMAETAIAIGAARAAHAASVGGTPATARAARARSAGKSWPHLDERGQAAEVLGGDADDLGAEGLDRHLGAGDVLLDQHGRDRRLPRSSERAASSPAAWRRTSAASQHRRTPRLPVPSAGFSTTGNPMAPAALRRPRRRGSGGPGRHGHPGAPRAAAGGACPGSVPRRPGRPRAGPSRAAARAVTATKYSELVTSPATAAPSAAARATAATEAASVVSARATSTPSSATQG